MSFSIFSSNFYTTHAFLYILFKQGKKRYNRTQKNCTAGGKHVNRKKIWRHLLKQNVNSFFIKKRAIYHNLMINSSLLTYYSNNTYSIFFLIRLIFLNFCNTRIRMQIKQLKYIKNEAFHFPYAFYITI